MNVLGLDIGGANLKAACSNGLARSIPFALWKQPQNLANALRQLVADWHWDRVAVTMTGELCDCFETKRVGVLSILTSTQQVFGKAMVWRNDGRFANIDESLKDPLPCAAANWLALATFAGRFCPVGKAVLIDMGSTTTDIILLRDGKPIPRGRTDTARLQSGELVYVGMRRTPVCALLAMNGMAEFFATTQDVGLILGDLEDDEADRDTADQRPATREFALARLARMIGGDRESMRDSEIMALAQQVRLLQLQSIRDAMDRLIGSSPVETAILSGMGESIVCKAIQAKRIISLNRELGMAASITACAYAVGVLAQEHICESQRVHK